MSGSEYGPLSRRERQIMDAVFQLGRATAVEIRDCIPDPPGQDAVRALIRVLESKGHLRHVKEGVRHVYLPTRDTRNVRRSAVRRVVDTFFGGSVAGAVSSMLSESESDLNDEELARLADLIDRQRKGQE